MRPTLSLPPSIPPSASISEWFSSRNTLLRRQLKKSERAKQAVLLDALSAPSLRAPSARPLSAYEDCLCLLPIVVSQPTSGELRASSPSEQASRRRRLLWRWGSRSRDPVWALPSLPRSPGSAARPPGAGFRAPVAVFLSQVWVLVAAPLALGLGNVVYLCCEEGKRRDGDGLSLP